MPFDGTRELWCTMSNPGWSGCSGHHGTPALDFGLPVGTPVHATGDGVVHETATTDDDGRGLFVAVAHPDGTYSRYLHLSAVEVEEGDEVSRGDHLGLSGNSGHSTAPHLHYDEQKPYGTRIDPGPMYGIVDGALVSYPEALEHDTWWTAPYGSTIRTDGFPGPFLDVGDPHPFLEEITWLAGEEITTGYDDGTYRSHDPVLRQAMAAFLYRLAGSPAGPFPDPGFGDVDPLHPFHTEIAWLADGGIATGFDDGTFGNFEPVRRQAMAAFLYRLAGSPAGPFPDPGFGDVDPLHPFHTEIAWLATTGITTGYDDGTFRPENVVSRQAMAAFLHRYVQ
ncbi:MAG: S-layer homology domain-containing protein [Acidimicrobiia bacterium]|nr:S-layer homology domain-containing protein [Acidimicrobiia bacterium]